MRFSSYDLLRTPSSDLTKNLPENSDFLKASSLHSVDLLLLRLSNGLQGNRFAAQCPNLPRVMLSTRSNRYSQFGRSRLPDEPTRRPVDAKATKLRGLSRPIATVILECVAQTQRYGGDLTTRFMSRLPRSTNLSPACPLNARVSSAARSIFWSAYCTQSIPASCETAPASRRAFSRISEASLAGSAWSKSWQAKLSALTRARPR